MIAVTGAVVMPAQIGDQIRLVFIGDRCDEKAILKMPSPRPVATPSEKKSKISSANCLNNLFE